MAGVGVGAGAGVGGETLSSGERSSVFRVAWLVTLELFPAICSRQEQLPAGTTPTLSWCPGVSQGWATALPPPGVSGPGHRTPSGGQAPLSPLLPETCFCWILREVKCPLVWDTGEGGSRGSGCRECPGSVLPPGLPPWVLVPGGTKTTDAGSEDPSGLTPYLAEHLGRMSSVRIF